MKRLLLSAALLGLFTGVASAQVAAPPPPAPPVAGVATPPAPPPPGGPGAERPGPMGQRKGMPGHDRRGPPPPPPSGAAHFRLEGQGLRLDVKCADDEPMRACADIAIELLARAQAQAPAPRP